MAKNVSLDFSITIEDILIIHQKTTHDEKEYHSHEHHEILIPISGEFSLKDKINNEFLITTGNAVYLPPQCEHHFQGTKQGRGERLILLIPKKRLNVNTEDITLFKISQLIVEIIFHLIIKNNDHLTQKLCHIFLELLTEDIANTSSPANLVSLLEKSSDDRIIKAGKYIFKNYHEKISVTAVSEIANMSQRNFSRLFLKEVGIGAKEFINMVRVQKSTELIRENNLNITQICYDVGFQSLPSFIAAFKKYTGKIPSEYK